VRRCAEAAEEHDCVHQGASSDDRQSTHSQLTTALAHCLPSFFLPSFFFRFPQQEADEKASEILTKVREEREIGREKMKRKNLFFALAFCFR
jgi:hypothetical protein